MKNKSSVFIILILISQINCGGSKDEYEGSGWRRFLPGSSKSTKYDQLEKSGDDGENNDTGESGDGNPNNPYKLGTMQYEFMEDLLECGSTDMNMAGDVCVNVEKCKNAQYITTQSIVKDHSCTIALCTECPDNNTRIRVAAFKNGSYYKLDYSCQLSSFRMAYHPPDK